LKNSIVIIALVAIILFAIKKFKVKKQPEAKISLPSKKMTKEQFINFLSPSVKVIAEKTKIPYQFLMAQMALETGWGRSELFYKHNNVGGIRSFKPESEAHENYWTWEHVLPSDLGKWDKYERDKTKDEKLPNGKIKIRVKLPFRSFANLVDGLQYYLNNVLLNKYFKNYIVESGGNAEKYVELLQSKKYGAMYATDSNYVPKIKSLMKEFKV
jgi:flagellar protein FlgJ